MDAVYFVRPGRSHEELRYSLRSLTNLPHNKVHIIGHIPEWATNIIGHPRERLETKYATTTAHMRYACETDTISDPFILMNDDFFIVKKVRELHTYHRGPVRDVIADYRARTLQSPYVRGMQQTLRLLEDAGHTNPNSYELHIPMVIKKAGMLAALDLGKNLPVAHKRTIYGVINNIGGQRTQDVKMRTMDAQPPTGPWLSSMDTVFQYGAGNIVKWLFPNPGRHEA